MAKHYTIKGTTIYADILALTEKEEAEVNKFVKFGYTVVNKEEVKATVSGIYITEVRGVRGPLATPPEKVGFFKRMKRKILKAAETAQK